MNESETRVGLLSRLVKARRRGSETTPYTLFVGAGASLSSGAALFSEVFRQLGEDDYASFSNRVRSLSGDERFAILSPLISGLQPSEGARRLARIALQGYFTLILTTNFDDLLERALMMEGATPSDFMIGVNTPRTPLRDLAAYCARPTPAVKIIKLHGDLYHREFALTDEETMQFQQSVEESLRRHFTQNDVIVVGSKFRDMDLLRCMNSLGGTIWYVNPTEPEDAVRTLIRAKNCGNCVISGDCGHFERFVELLGAELEPVAQPEPSGFSVVSHKFVPVALGHTSRSLPGSTERQSAYIDYSEVRLDDHARLCVLPFGIGVWHLTDNLDFASLADLAVWRRQTYQSLLHEGSSLQRNLRLLTQQEAPDKQRQSEEEIGRPGYVLSLYVLTKWAWADDEELHAALRILCCPGVLQAEDRADISSEEAMRLERSLLSGRFDSPDIHEFGLPGIASGYASWAGVSFCAHSQERAISTNQLVEFEIAVQGLWWYFHCLRERVFSQTAVLPESDAETASSALELLRRLRAIGPTEQVQSRTMREAILSTSRLEDLATDIHTLIKEMR